MLSIFLILFIFFRIPNWIKFLEEINESLIEKNKNSITFKFQNKSYPVVLKRGTYKLEAYGASGGSGNLSTTARDPQNQYKCLYDDEYVKQLKGNTKCNILSSQGGSGGYASGIIKLLKDTKIFIVVGSQGNYATNKVQGGFNGGGNAISLNGIGVGSGGGSVDFRVDKDDPFHRVLVAGGGGGSDDVFWYPHPNNDGTGGSGGLPAQGYWKEGTYQAGKEANSTFGFSFFQGESAIAIDEVSEFSGAGGGFFGGFASHFQNAGSSGGSSFALSKYIEIPSNELIINHIDGTEERGYYAFDYNSPYLLHNVQFATGIWSGNGQARITWIPPFTPIHIFNKILKKRWVYM